MASVSCSDSGQSVSTYSRFEVVLKTDLPHDVHPFLDVRVDGVVTSPSGKRWEAEGFCDSVDGTEYRFRVMPTEAGEYTVAVVLRQHGEEPVTWTTKFSAKDDAHPGIVRLDPEHPRHFAFSANGEHYFWNGTTAYYLMGWKNDEDIDAILDRLSSKGVNRVRALIYGREYDNPWRTPVHSTDSFTMCLNPWVARFPDDVTNPDFDLTRFNVEFWRRFERMLVTADERQVQVSACFFIGGQPLAVPFQMWSEDEYRYYRYAIARLASFPNLMWDLGNEHNFHRDNVFWVNTMGSEVQRRDPYRHLTGIHNRAYHDSWGDWLTVQLHQTWDAGVSEVLSKNDEKQAQAGRIIPQILEEYGYEDLWERFPGHRSTETRRRVCWEITMAGFYQTNGETPAGGTGTGPDTGGGWVNGRGAPTSTMFDQIKPMKELFTSLRWWELRPAAEAVLEYEPSSPNQVTYYYSDGRIASDRPAQVLCDQSGVPVLIYLPYGGRARIKSGTSLAGAGFSRIAPATGAEQALAPLDGTVIQTSWTDGPDDMVYVIRRG